MTQTTELQATETKTEVTVKAKPQLSEGTVKAFINGHVEGPAGSWLQIKTVVPCRYYRLNFIISTQNKGDVVPDNRFADSRFIEVVHTPQGLSLVEHKDTSKPRRKLFE